MILRFWVQYNILITLYRFTHHLLMLKSYGHSFLTNPTSDPFWLKVR